MTAGRLWGLLTDARICQVPHHRAAIKAEADAAGWWTHFGATGIRELSIATVAETSSADDSSLRPDGTWHRPSADVHSRSKLARLGSLCPETFTVVRWHCRQIATEDAEASFRQIIDGESVDSQ
jgi:hypothetical protein